MNYQKSLIFFCVLTVMMTTACVSAVPEEQLEAEPIAQVEVTPIPLVEEKATPISPIATPTPQPSPTPTVIFQPPFCQFDTAEKDKPQDSESLLDKYVFSEPRPVLDYPVGIEIIQWLPGDQRLLISRIGEGRRIEVFNIQSGKIKEYAEGGSNGLSRLIWLNKEQAVAFSDIDPNGQYVLYIVRENGKVKKESTDLASLNLAVGPNGQRVTFVSKSNRAKPKFFNAAISQPESIPFIEFELPETKAPNHPFKRYKINWHPDKKRFIYYNDHAFYLADSHTGDVCELDLGSYGGRKQRSAIASWSPAQWSPDGRYLAIFTTVGEPIVPFIDLTVIDMLTGERKTLVIEGSEDKYAMTWAPNSRDLLVVAQNPIEDDRHNLYLVDVVTGNSRQMLENAIFLFTAYAGVAWSSNGKMIALDCPWSDQIHPKQLCLIDVEVK